MDFQPPPWLRPLLQRIEGLAREAGLDAWAVGGTVRDVLLDRDLRDLDVAVDRDALAWSRSAAGALGGSFVELDDVHAVARIVLPAGAPLRYIDIAQAQGALEQDLRRRDFTVDALAAPLTGGAVIDVCGGLGDLAGRLIRMTSAAALDADPLRLLRGARLAAELHFAIEPSTDAAIRERAPGVLEAAAERRRDELARIFLLDDAGAGLRIVDRLGLLDPLLPEVTAGRGVTQPKEHAYDVFEHALRTVEAMDALLAPAPAADAPDWLPGIVWRTFAAHETELRAYLAAELSEGRSRSALLKLAALLHDIAKPGTRTVDATGRVRFFGHADAGATMAAGVMRRYRFSARETRFVALLVEEHLRPVQLAQVGEVPTRRALYRFCRDLGDAVPAALLLSLADAAAARGPRLTPLGWSRQVAYMNSLLVRSVEDAGIVNPPRFLTGRDLMSELGLGEGPLIGRLLEELREAQATGAVSDREGALAFARERAREEGARGTGHTR